MDRIYRSKAVLDVELSGYKIMETLMKALIGAAVEPEHFHSQQLIRRFSSQYDIQSPCLETRIMQSSTSSVEWQISMHSISIRR